MPTLRKRPPQVTGLSPKPAPGPPCYDTYSTHHAAMPDRIAARIMKADEKFDPIL